jgi:hypothetical protein
MSIEGSAEAALATRGIGAQLRLACVDAVRAFGRMSRRSWGWLALYVGLSTALLFGIAAALSTHEGTIGKALLRFLFPEEWHGILDFVLAFALKSQRQQVIANVALFVTLTVVSIVLFWAKEALSRSYERDRAAHAGEPDPKEQWEDHPAWREALDEILWTLIGLAALFATLWVGHGPPDPVRKTIATVLSYLVVFVTTAGNFLAPPMQRRKMTYSHVLVVMARRPLVTLAFGAAMAVPQLVALNVAGQAGLDALATLLIVFSINVVFIAISAVAGTEVGLALLPVARTSTPPRWPVRALGWSIVVAILATGTFIGARLGTAILAKSQVLKCTYRIDWKSFRFDEPKLGGLLKGELGVAGSIEMDITNPTPLPVRIEKNRLVLADDDVIIAESHLAPFEVPPQATSRAKVGLDLTLDAGSFLKGARLDPTRWDITFYIELDEGLEFPIYLRAGP